MDTIIPSVSAGLPSLGLTFLLVLQLCWTPEALRSRRHSVVLPAVETVASYPTFARKIRNPCGMSARPLAETRRVARSTRGAEPLTDSEEKSWGAETCDILLSLAETFHVSVGTGEEEALKEMKSNSAKSAPAKLKGLRRSRRSLEDSEMESGSLGTARVRGLLAAVARLDAEVEEARAMVVSFN